MGGHKCNARGDEAFECQIIVVDLGARGGGQVDGVYLFGELGPGLLALS